MLLEGEKSTIFSLEQGVAQGCSLSPVNQLHSVISNRDINFIVVYSSLHIGPGIV